VSHRRWLDVTDLAFYLSRHSSVSGIQRVMAQSAPLLLRDLSVDLVLFSEARSSFVHLPREQGESFLEMLEKTGENPEHKGRLRQRAAALLTDAALSTEINVVSGDVFVILGAAWIFPRYFRAIREIRAQGAAVVVLVYDLIPVMTSGFHAQSVLQFRRYLEHVMALADRVPAISNHSRLDFEKYCLESGRLPIAGGVARLGTSVQDWNNPTQAIRPWHRPYVLFVGTIEARKGHQTAFLAWRILTETMDPDLVPDLICVGRVGWNVDEFLEAVVTSRGLQGRVHIWDQGVSDGKLHDLYLHCLFTIYPSSYEGWGLPVAESLAHGKPVITIDGTSLREVGGDLARYVQAGDYKQLATEIRSLILNPMELSHWADQIQRNFKEDTWEDFVKVLEAEMDMAVDARDARTAWMRPEIGVEYGLGKIQSFVDKESDGGAFLTNLVDSRRLPLTGEAHTVSREVVGDLFLVDGAEEAERWGRSISAGGSSLIRLRRPSADHLIMILTTRKDYRHFQVVVEGPLGRHVAQGTGGMTVVVDLGRGPDDARVDVCLMVSEVFGDAIPGSALGLESITISRSDDKFCHVDVIARQLEVLSCEAEHFRGQALQAERAVVQSERAVAEAIEVRQNNRVLEEVLAAKDRELSERQALIEELLLKKTEYEENLRLIWSSSSWRMTSPLRRFVGRG
jgi:glycosyltransferase involved in cell wall biosynthesis